MRAADDISDQQRALGKHRNAARVFPRAGGTIVMGAANIDRSAVDVHLLLRNKRTLLLNPGFEKLAAAPH